MVKLFFAYTPSAGWRVVHPSMRMGTAGHRGRQYEIRGENVRSGVVERRVHVRVRREFEVGILYLGIWLWGLQRRMDARIRRRRTLA
jgi:hypothetical protein